MSHPCAVRVTKAMKSASDVELVRALARGSTQAFDALYALYARRLMRLLLHLTHEPSAAEDLYQEAWLKLAKSAASLSADTRVYPWLVQVCRNDWVSRLRRERRWSALDEPELYADGAPQPDERLDFERTVDALGGALGRLPDTDRELLLLVAMDGLAGEDVAHILGISHAAVRQRLSRARARLHGLLSTPLSPTPLHAFAKKGVP
jgi:RNA polymerase sigma factor (sigma-70 family)